VMTSPDGITWTTQTSAADNNWLSVTWAPEIPLFVAVANTGTGNRVMTTLSQWQGADFKNFRLASTDSTQSIDIYPTPDFAEELDLQQKYQRSIAGQLNTYKISSAKQYKYSVPLTFVGSGERDILTSWWKNQNELIFSYGSGSIYNSIHTRIINNTKPLNIRNEQQIDKYYGILRLANSRSSGKLNGSLFILDDPVMGLLDQSYNYLG